MKKSITAKTIIVTIRANENDFVEYTEKVKISVPADFAEAKANIVPANQYRTGIYVTASYRGRKWGVVKFYSQWVNNTGACDGDYFVAFDLTKADEKSIFDKIENM